MPATMGGKGGMKMTVILDRPDVDREGRARHGGVPRFYKGAVEKGWIFSDPRGAKGTARPGQGDGRDVPAAGGDRRHSVRAGNERQDERRRPDGRRDGEDGQHHDDHDRQSVETGALAADLFAPPAGYKIKEQK